VGKYDVRADVGPAYQTKRREAFNAFSQIAAQNPEMMNTIGDLMFKSADFPGADEIAERFKRIIPPHILGEGVSPNEQKLNEEMQNMGQLLESALDELASVKGELKDKGDKNEIDAFNATTKRLEVILDQYEVSATEKAKIMKDLFGEIAKAEINLEAKETPSSEIIRTAQ
jgi:hypothetical protein